MATTFGFSCLQGPHHDAQKSTIVTFPKLSLRETVFPCGLGAEKSVLHLAGAAGTAEAPTEGVFNEASLVFTALPCLEFFKDSSRPLYIVSIFLESTAGSLLIPSIINKLIKAFGCVFA